MAGTFRAVAGVTGMPSQAVPGDSTDPVRVATAVAAHPAWDLAVEDSVAVVGASAAAALAAVVAVAASAAVVVAAVVGGKRRHQD